MQKNKEKCAARDLTLNVKGQRDGVFLLWVFGGKQFFWLFFFFFASMLLFHIVHGITIKHTKKPRR